MRRRHVGDRTAVTVDGTLISADANGTTTNYAQDLAGSLTQVLVSIPC
jgi:hypothetical protein